MRVSAATMRPTRAGRDDRRAPLHVDLQDRAHFHGTPDLQDRTTLRDLYGVCEVIGLDEAEAANDILGLGVGTVGDDLPVTLDDHAGHFQRMSQLFEVAFLAELLKP